MPPKTDEPKGATTRSAAAKKEETAAADPSSAPSALEEKMERVLAKFDLLAALPAKVDDLCLRMGALELRSGRNSPAGTPPTAAATATPATTVPPAPVGSTTPGSARPEVTTVSAPTSDSRTTGPASAPATAPRPAPSSQAAPPTAPIGRDARGPNPWSDWPTEIQGDMRWRLSKQGKTLTQFFAETDYPSPSTTAGRDQSSTDTAQRDFSAAPHSRQLICKHETLGSFNGDPTKLEGFLSRVRAIGRKRLPGWEDAVLAAVPDALTGQAAKWHASLTDQETAALSTLEALIAAMRRAFPINRAQLRALARQRKWEPEDESAMNYYFDKLLLMRQAFGDTYSEKALAQDVADGLDASMRGYVRLPPESPTLQKLQDAMAEWEPIWREVHRVHLRSVADDTSHAAGMTRSQSEPAITSTAVPPTTPLPPLQPPPRPPRSEHRQPMASNVAPRSTTASVGSLAQTYDPSRIMPAANGQPRMYRIPDSSRIMRLNRNCNKCGQAHFDFEHDHLLTSGITIQSS